jgi:hypothetical protein
MRLLPRGDGFENAKKLLGQAKALAIEEKDEDAQRVARTPISGIGDDAYYSTDGVTTTLSVKKGDVAFDVGVYGDFPGDRVKAMAKTLALEILSKL